MDIKAVNDLIKLAEASTHEALEEEKDSGLSPIITRAKSMMLNAMPDNFTKVKFTMLQGNKESVSIEGTDFRKNVSISINWIVTLLKDLVKKVNGQTDLITSLVKKLATLVPRDDLEAELEKKPKQLEADFQKAVDENRDALEEKFKLKHESLEVECDEARQRGLKGNLIVSSPKRVTNDGKNMKTLAVKTKIGDRMETDMEMVVRLVQQKTGHTIPKEDIYACHRIGKNPDSNAYVLCVSNRKPGSVWETITTGMRKGFKDVHTTTNNNNIFINYQLTHRRIAISKEVKKAKKSNLIQKYSIDANGKIWIKPINTESFKEVSSIDNLQKLINNIET